MGFTEDKEVNEKAAGPGLELPFPGALGRKKRNREGRTQLPQVTDPLHQCFVPHPHPQGPFVHLSVMISAYLGRVRAKTMGESQVRGTRKSPFDQKGKGAGPEPRALFSPE